MNTMRIQSIHIGIPETILYRGKEIQTAINKKPVTGEICLNDLNLEGDAQADLINHGGADKAVCVYPAEHYAYWEQRLGISLPLSAFGENLTTEGMTEADVRLGDKFQIGTAVVQVSQPRQPCFKLGHKHQMPELPAWVRETGYTGYYFRVLKPGVLRHSDIATLIETGPAEMTIAKVNQILHKRANDKEELRSLLRVDALAQSLRLLLTKRLEEA